MVHEPLVIPTTPFVVPMKDTVIGLRGAPGCDGAAPVPEEHPLTTAMIGTRKMITDPHIATRTDKPTRRFAFIVDWTNWEKYRHAELINYKERIPTMLIMVD